MDTMHSAGVAKDERARLDAVRAKAKMDVLPRAENIRNFVEVFLILSDLREEVYCTPLYTVCLETCNVAPLPHNAWEFMIIRRPIEPDLDSQDAYFNDRGGYRQGQEIIARVTWGYYGRSRVSMPLLAYEEGWSVDFKEGEFRHMLARAISIVSVYDYENRKSVSPDPKPVKKKRFWFF